MAIPNAAIIPGILRGRFPTYDPRYMTVASHTIPTRKATAPITTSVVNDKLINPDLKFLLSYESVLR
jgi:hypothetical protein